MIGHTYHGPVPYISCGSWKARWSYILTRTWAGLRVTFEMMFNNKSIINIELLIMLIIKYLLLIIPFLIMVWMDRWQQLKWMKWRWYQQLKLWSGHELLNCGSEMNENETLKNKINENLIQLVNERLIIISLRMADEKYTFDWLIGLATCWPVMVDGCG